jgi:hypothetical protein
MVFSVIRDLISAYESLSHLLPQAPGLPVTQCGIGMVVSTLMWHWVNRAGLTGTESRRYPSWSRRRVR